MSKGRPREYLQWKMDDSGVWVAFQDNYVYLIEKGWPHLTYFPEGKKWELTIKDKEEEFFYSEDYLHRLYYETKTQCIERANWFWHLEEKEDFIP